MAAQEKELERARISGHRRLEIAILTDLAECYLDRNKVHEVKKLYFELSRHAADLEDSSLRMRADIGLARIEWAREKPDLAIEKLERLMEGSPQDLRLQSDVLLMLGSQLHQLEAERLLASIAVDQRDYDDAVRRLESALLLVRFIGIPSLITSVNCDLANAYLRAGDQVRAVAAAREASTTSSQIELPINAAEALMTIGQVRTELRHRHDHDLSRVRC